MTCSKTFKKKLRAAYAAMTAYPQWRNQLTSDLLQIIERKQETSLTLQALQVTQRGPSSTNFKEEFASLNKRIKEATALCGSVQDDAETLYLNFLYACQGMYESDESELLLLMAWEQASAAFPDVQKHYQNQIKS